MSGLNPGHLHSRIRGRAALERRARALLIAIHRYGRGRQLAAGDLDWAARAIDQLTMVLQHDQKTTGRPEVPTGRC
jgi:cephalosporin-C deacetylase-like acetyl esterase